MNKKIDENKELDKKEIKYATLDLDKVQTINKKGKLDIDF